MTMRFFNTAGPVNPAMHYTLPPLERLNLPEVLRLIAQHKYFVLHAPRQTGKTSALLALMHYLNASGAYRALYVNVEIGQAAREEASEAITAILGRLAEEAQAVLGDTLLLQERARWLASEGPHGALQAALSAWAQAEARPAVLLLDEVDALIGDTLISVLRQLRAGYTNCPARFPQTVVLCGVRDVRDYRIHSSRSPEIITGGSAFNIKAVSLRLGDFSRADMERLYAQHTAETGQVFLPEALDLAWELTQGQPWLVNALAYETCFNLERDRARPITAALMVQAKENLIDRRETHLDQLADKLREPRVRRVLEPLLAGDDRVNDLPDDDVQYVLDLGLVRRTPALAVANALYREVIPRQLLTFIKVC